MRRLLLFFALAAGAFAQGQAVNQVGSAPPNWAHRAFPCAPRGAGVLLLLNLSLLESSAAV